MQGTRLIKPTRLNILHRTYTVQGRHTLCLTGLGLFDFDDPDRLLVDQALWPMVADVLGDQMLDMAMPKARGEVIVHGRAMAPAGQAVQAMDVSIAIAPVQKTVRVFGDRHWVRPATGAALQITAPKAFTQMDVSFANAFGGQGFAENEKGKGYKAADRAAQGEAVALPNVEDPRRPIADPGQTPAPVGLASIDIAAPSRQKKAGTYDQAWLDHDYPGLARDIDWTMFNAAPPDQWINTAWRGDEDFTVQGFHPDHPVDRSRLPALRMRGFARHLTADGPAFSEMPMQLDTVWLFPSQRKGIVGWRGLLAVTDSDGLDVTDLVIAAEGFADPARPPEHYKAVQARRADIEQAAFDVLNDAPLMPLPDPAAEAARLERLAQKKAERKQERLAKVARNYEFGIATAAAEGADPARIDEGLADFGGLEALIEKAQEPNEFTDILDEMPVVDDEVIADGTVDLAGIIDTAKRLQEAAAKKKTEVDAFVEQQKAEHLADIDALLAEGQAQDGPELEARLRAKVLGNGPADGMDDLFDIDQFLAGGDAAPDGLEQKLSTAREQLNEGLYAARSLAPEPVGPMDRLSDKMATFLADLIGEAVRDGVSLAGRDLAGAALAGQSLVGQDLSQSMLDRADLTRADLTSAKTQGLVLCGAKLGQARLTGCDLTKANLGSADASAADFTDADLTRAVMMKARFDGARLEGATLMENQIIDAAFTSASLNGVIANRCVFINCDLENAKLDGASFTECIFINGKMAGISARSTQFKSCVFYDCVLDGGNFERARFEVCALTGQKASFRGCHFAAIDAPKSLWRDAQLSGLNFAMANFDGSDLSGADFSDAILERASLVGTLAMTTNFSGAELMQAKLPQTILRKANFERTDLRAAILVSAEVTEARFAGADLRAANLDKVRMPREPAR